MKTWLLYLIDFDQDVRLAKNPDHCEKFWQKLSFEVESCAEADQLFPDMLRCPVCSGELNSKTLFVTHRPLNWN
jgi:uncharacterized protein with PIN domain